jgi:hypothetical protein
VPGLEFLAELHSLFALAIQLGGTKNLEVLPALRGLRVLQLQLIKGLSDLSAVARMTELEYLRLSFLRQVVVLPDMAHMLSLKSVLLDGMRGLIGLEPLLSAPRLEEFFLCEAPHFQPDQIACMVSHTHLQRTAIALSTIRKSDAAQALLSTTEVSWRDVHYSPHYEYR